MANYSYIAVDAQGGERRGILEVATQMEAVRRVREMGLFPTKIRPDSEARLTRRTQPRQVRALEQRTNRLRVRWPRGVKKAKLVTFTRQLATLLEAGMPLVRGLRILEEQAECRRLKAIVRGICSEIENGASLSEALASHPPVFNNLYVNLVKAGEAAGALESSLSRLADFMERSQKLRGKLVGAMFYPVAVVVVAMGVLALLMVFVVPSFQKVFEGLLEGAPLPAFTRLVFGLSSMTVHRLPELALAAICLGLVFFASVKTRFGSQLFDEFKLAAP